MTKKREIVYISGPMRGVPEWNRPLFDRVTAQFRAEGHSVLNPAEWAEHNGWAFNEYLSRDLHMMMGQKYISSIIMIPGLGPGIKRLDWRESEGACVELFCAVTVKGAVAYEWREANVLRPLKVTRDELLNLIAHPAEV